ncbi:MAG: cell division protein FtsA [Spirochaetes bacterium]|nr:cell division protein FtsA [Spirochaetota bacterium]
MAKSGIITGLDVGSFSVKTIIAELTAEGEVNVLGTGCVESKGVRKGVVVNIDAASQAIAASIEKAEIMAGTEAGGVIASIGGDHLLGINSKGVIGVTSRNREITETEVERVMESARSVRLPAEREIIHLVPQEYSVDDQDEVKNPVGMTGTRLEAEAHLITGLKTAGDNLMKAVEKAGFFIEDIIAAPYAAAAAVLAGDEKELGAALIDIGGSTTTVMLFVEGAVWHTAVIPVGGMHVTNDIAMGLRLPHIAAEDVKVRYGTAMPELAADTDIIEIPSLGDRPPRTVPKRALAEIIAPRLEEIFRLVQKEIDKAECRELLGAGAVVTGGLAQLNGISDMAEAVLGTMPVRVGHPKGFTGMLDVTQNAGFAVAVGLVIKRLEEEVVPKAPSQRRERASAKSDSGFGRKIGDWFKEFFS